MANNVNHPCITCTYVGSDPISQINLSAAPPNMKKRKWNASSGSTSNQNRAVTNHGNNSTTNSNNSGEDLSVWLKNSQKPVKKQSCTNNLGQNQDLALKDEQIIRPKYVFSKTYWTQDKEQALEKLLMK